MSGCELECGRPCGFGYGSGNRLGWKCYNRVCFDDRVSLMSCPETNKATQSLCQSLTKGVYAISVTIHIRQNGTKMLKAAF